MEGVQADARDLQFASDSKWHMRRWARAIGIRITMSSYGGPSAVGHRADRVDDELLAAPQLVELVSAIRITRHHRLSCAR